MSNLLVGSGGGGLTAEEIALLTMGIPGLDGDDGETPVLSLHVDGDRVVHKLEGHLDPDGVFTALGSDMYVGADGYTDVLADAVDVSGSDGANAIKDNWASDPLYTDMVKNAWVDALA